ncbi:MAG: T9SS type A sorting domain-containing protein [Ignavibacteria bacterium]|nr:T9SS type A sorting domain-containing protein [Ignavibacteria bacterium]
MLNNRKQSSTNGILGVLLSIFVALFVTLAIRVQSQVLGDSSYFPLDIGNQWTLQGINPIDIRIETVVDTQVIGGNLYYMFDQFRDHAQVPMRMVENRVFRYMDTSEVLWHDFSVDVGEIWSVPTPFGGEWTVSLLSKTDTIHAPAGTFTNCYHFYFAGISDYEWEEWFAPGVGIVERKLHGFAFFDWTLIDVIITSVDETDLDVPKNFFLYQNYPNPFNPTTTISYSLPTAQRVSLEVYDLLGRQVGVLLNENVHEAGKHAIQFDGNNLVSGVYLYRL